MSREQLTQEALALPMDERVQLAELLWRTINQGLLPGEGDDDAEALQKAKSRDAELSSGAVIGRTHEEVMEAARHALECD